MAFANTCEAAVANAVEDAGELLLAVRKVYWCPDVVVALAAPIVQLVAEHPGIGLADEHVFVAREAKVEVLREAEVAIVGSGVEIAFVEEFCPHRSAFVPDDAGVFVQFAALVGDENDVVPPQDAEGLADGRTFPSRGYIFIYGYDDNAVLHLSLRIRMSPAESV